MSGITRFPPELGTHAFQARAFRDEKDLAPGRWRRVRTWRRGQRIAFAAETCFASLPFCDLLLDRAFEAAPRSLFEARELASLAAELAAQLEGRGCPPPLARDCRARTALARAFLALAAGEIAEAESLLPLGRTLAGEGSGDAQLGVELALAEQAVSVSGSPARAKQRPGGLGLIASAREAAALGEERTLARLLFLKAWGQARHGEVEPRLLERLETARDLQLTGAAASLRLAHRLHLGAGNDPEGLGIKAVRCEDLTAPLAGSGDPLAEPAGMALLALAEAEQGVREGVLDGLHEALLSLVEHDLFAAAGFYGLAAAVAFARAGEPELLAGHLARFPLDQGFFGGAPRLGVLAEAFTWWAEAGRSMGAALLADWGSRFDDRLRGLPAAHPLVLTLLAPTPPREPHLPAS